ncbi:hotdog fold thioesterase [Nakamurella sp. YIM 132087]|uniref:Hotdog fold thioesterase n=1 Tax=Nakamurella alba TaxID=2665158 RepID=A0A7K1FQ63_9ACTN|nr:PaaI family thioesterase [Nakamurella alba]MTD16292.1 hotdog fold thioesterase [Nakamurella alba]
MTATLPTGLLADRLGIEVLEAGPERVVARMPVAGNQQPDGLLAGGASCMLAESVSSRAAALHAAEMGAKAVGVELNATHHRSATSGHVTAVATVIHRGRTAASYQVVVTDEAGKRICTARVLCLVVRRPGHDPNSTTRAEET